MAKEKLIPWTIRHCDAKTFDGMGWVCRKKGTLFLDWTRQGNTGWIPSDAARAWAKQKGHLKNKKPRDLKAGLRNAFRSKSKELVKVHIPKEIAERDGRKRMIWRFLDLESELKKISNPPAKGGKAKKSTITKSRRDMDKIMLEENSPSCSSTLSDCEHRFLKPEETQAKGETSKKKGTRTKVTSKNPLMSTLKSLPPYQSIKRNNSCNETNAYTPPLQFQDISSTFTEAIFLENVPDCVLFTSQQLSSCSSGPTPPPQETDIVHNVTDGMSQIILTDIKSDNRFSYYKYQGSLSLNHSDENGQSPHSSSYAWNIPMPNQLQNSQVTSQLDESNHSPHSSPLLYSPSPNHFQDTQVCNKSDGNMNIPHCISTSLYSSRQNQFKFTQVPNQPGRCDTTPSDAQPYLFTSYDQFQDGVSQSQNISDEQMCDSLQRVTSPNIFSLSHDGVSQSQNISDEQMCGNLKRVTSPSLFSRSHDHFQDGVSQSQNISDEQICDSWQRVTSPSLYSNVTFPDLIGQYSPPGSENLSLFPDFTLLESSQSKEEAPVEWGFDDPITALDNTENSIDLSQLITMDFNLL